VEKVPSGKEIICSTVERHYCVRNPCNKCASYVIQPGLQINCEKHGYSSMMCVRQHFSGSGLCMCEKCYNETKKD